MKKIIITFCVLLVSMNVFAQTLDLNEPLPENQKVKKGILKNGMTYYIYKTDVVKNAASYYIIQNVGSILENDDQQGLAHFLEHMAFNGTKNFEGKGVFESIGRSFKLIRGKWWSTFGLMIVATVLMYAVSMIFILPFYVFYSTQQFSRFTNTGLT